MENVDDNNSTGRSIWTFVRRYVLNKYVIVLVGFSVFMTFVGNQSLIRRFERAHEIDSLRIVRDSLRNKIEQTDHKLKVITNNKDSMERFAREQYYMHAQDEEVIIIPDKK